MRKALFSLMVTMTAAAAAVGDAHGQEPFLWKRALAAGRTIDVRTVTGDVSATPSSSNEVEVVAMKTAGRNGAPEDVRIVVEETSSGVVICTVYPSRRGNGNGNASGCDGSGNTSTDRNDTRVDFEVRVPRGVRFHGGSVSGDVEATGLGGFVKGSSVSGDVRISTSDLAEASSVSGEVHVKMGRANWDGTLKFSSVSGDVVVEMPASLDADVSASTVSGEITSDWPVTMSGRWGPRSMNGTIGRGGRQLTLSTVSGAIELRRN